MGFRYILRAKGLLKSDGSSNTGNFEAFNVILKMETVINSFSVPECTLFTWTPGYGAGLVDVRGIPGIGERHSLQVQFSPPQDLNWQVDMSASCDGQSTTYNANFPITSAQDPWITADFPSGVGTRKVVVDIFEQGVKNFTAGGSQSSYFGTLTLERVVEK